MGVEPLNEACELAFSVARFGRESVPPIDSPPAMRSFLWVAQLPPRAMTVAQRVINTDEEFRGRVAAHATEAKVGRAGYLWLTRPAGWESEFAALTGSHAQAGVAPAVAPAAVAPAPAATQSPVPSAVIPPIPAPPTPPMPTPPTPAPPTPAPPVPSVAAPVAPPAPPAPPIPSALATPAAAETSRSIIEGELADLRGLVDQLADERHVASAPAISEAELTELTELSNDLANERDAALADSARIADQLSMAEQRIAELERERASFEQERSLVADSLASAEANIGTSRKQADTARVERDEAIADRDAAIERADAAEVARAELEAELTGLSEQWVVVQAELAEITEQRISVEAELERLSQARVVSVHDNAALFNRLASQLEVVETAFGDLTQTTDVLSDGLAQITESKHDLNALLADAAEVHEANETSMRPVGAPEAFKGFGPIDRETAPAVGQPSAVEQAVKVEQPAEALTHVIPPMPSPPSFDELPPFEVIPVPGAAADFDFPEADETASVDAAPRVEDIPAAFEIPAVAQVEEPVVSASGTLGRAQVSLSDNARLDPALAAREVVQTVDVVVLVDGDAVAELGWPTLGLADRRGAIVEYLEGLAASTGAAAHVVFDRQLGGEDVKPESRAIRVELTLPQVSPSASLALRIGDYPIEWPVAVVSDDAKLSSEAASQGASQLGIGQLLDLFIAQ